MIRSLKTIAIAEGTSMIAFAVTMPLKYNFDILLPNKIVGWLHGLLFIVYIFSMIYAALKYKWPLRDIAIVLIASLIPFAPFYVEKKILRKQPMEG